MKISRKSKLDIHYQEIIDLLAMGVPKLRIAKEYGVNPGTLHWWLNTRGLREIKTHPLAKRCVRIIDTVVGGIQTELYHRVNREMEGMEHEGIWIGNGHHAAQRITEKVMKVLEPVLANAIRRDALR